MANFFDKFVNTMSDFGNKVSEKTTSSTENIRLTNAVKNEERQIANAYQEIGKKYRELYGANPAPEFAAFLDDISKREILVTEYRKKIQQNKGKMPCQSCGKEIECTAAFCAGCGAKNPVAEEIARAKAEAEAKAAAERAAREAAAREAQAKAQAAAQSVDMPQAAPVVDVAAEDVKPIAKTCPNCGKEVAEGNLFCTGCGTRQDA
ncbi:MAG: zinc ribbon domain-containing protein [Ruminococcus sp.]|nr:zinc ribbon domain-containing protein [Ruminococcus sp.]